MLLPKNFPLIVMRVEKGRRKNEIKNSVFRYQLFTRFIFIHAPHIFYFQLCLIKSIIFYDANYSFYRPHAAKLLHSSANEKCKKIPSPQKPKHTRPKVPTTKLPFSLCSLSLTLSLSDSRSNAFCQLFKCSYHFFNVSSGKDEKEKKNAFNHHKGVVTRGFQVPCRLNK